MLETSEYKESVANKEAIMTLAKEIAKIANGLSGNYDQTFKSVITGITDKGYTIRDTSGVTRNIKCCIPGASLKIGQSVWVTVPCGKIGEMFVCGVGWNWEEKIEYWLMFMGLRWFSESFLILSLICKEEWNITMQDIETTDKRILGQNDLYEILPFGKTKIMQLIKAGELPLVKVGKDYITTFNILEDWIKNHIGEEIYY